MNRYFLRTERLQFRAWSEGDLPLALQLWGDNRVTKFIDVRKQLSSDDVNEKLKNEIANMEKYGLQYWPIFLLDSDKLVGCCGLRPYKVSELIYEFGVHLCVQYWGYGYAQEAAQAIMQYGFNDLKAKALFAGHNPKNEQSKKMLTKLGFKYTHDEYYAPTGLQHPSYLITLAEYQEHYHIL